jgi:hypothetical protein
MEHMALKRRDDVEIVVDYLAGAIFGTIIA